MNRYHRASSLAFIVMCMAPVLSFGSTLGVSNIGQLDAASVGVGKTTTGFDFQEAGSFTTGSQFYILESVRIEIERRGSTQTAQPSGLNFSVYTGMSTTGPTGLIASLLGPTSPAIGFVDYISPPAFLLNPFTTYWLVASAPSTAFGTTFGLGATLSPDEDAGGLAGWSMGDKRWLTNNGGVSWNQAANTAVIEFAVVVTPVAPASVPESSSGVLLLGVTLSVLAAVSRRHANGR